MTLSRPMLLLRSQDVTPPFPQLFLPHPLLEGSSPSLSGLEGDWVRSLG